MTTPTPCNGTEQFNFYDCKNMKSVEGDTDMSFEHYECKVCGKRCALDYEEMR